MHETSRRLILVLQLKVIGHDYVGVSRTLEGEQTAVQNNSETHSSGGEKS